jgi:hypothetical protein
MRIPALRPVALSLALISLLLFPQTAVAQSVEITFDLQIEKGRVAQNKRLIRVSRATPSGSAGPATAISSFTFTVTTSRQRLSPVPPLKWRLRLVPPGRLANSRDLRIGEYPHSTTT